MTPAEHAKAIERAVEIYSQDFAVYCGTQALTDFRVCSVSLATLQAAIQAGVGAALPAAPAQAVPASLITASIMRDDGGEHPAFCLMVAYRAEKDATAALAMLTYAPAQPTLTMKPLQWCDEREPNEDVRYNHVVAESPLGRITIEWKGWKEHDSHCVFVGGQYIDACSTLEDTQQAAERHLRNLAEALTTAVPAPAIQPVAVASDSAPSLANDPRLCCRSHPHEKQSPHCQLREVAAWLRWHSAAGKTPSAESMRAHAEQVDAVALECCYDVAENPCGGITTQGDCNPRSPRVAGGQAMSRDDITAMAREAGIEFESQQMLNGGVSEFTDGSVSIGRMLRFAALVTAAERRAAQAAPVDAAKLPSPANVGTAPKCLNLNDQAMWVLGWNECLDAARAAQKGGAA